jgi:hypothetical protein
VYSARRRIKEWVIVVPYIEGFAANAETLVVLPLTLSAYLLLRRRWLLAGLAAGRASLLANQGRLPCRSARFP